MPAISLDDLQAVKLEEEGLREEVSTVVCEAESSLACTWEGSCGLGAIAAWLELFYDLLFVAGMIKLGAVTKKAEMDQIMYCCLIFSLFWTMWYQLQRYLSKHHKNNLAHIFLLFTQCAAVSQICINLISLKYLKKEIVEAKAVSIGILMSKTTIFAMYAYIVHKNRKKLREVRFSMIGLVLSTLCHIVCLGLDDHNQIFYLWTISIALELVCDVVSRIKYEQVNHDVEHHNAERLGCFTMVVLGESVIQLLLPDLEKLSESSLHRYAIAGLSGALVFNLAVIHFDKLPSLVHKSGDAERGASSLPPHNNKLAVVWTLFHLPMTFFMLLVGISMKYMFNNEKTSLATTWMLSISVGSILTFFTAMRFLRQGFKGKRKRLISYLVRILIAIATSMIPLFLPINDMETYWTIFPFTMISTIFVVIDMRQHFVIVEKAELVERKRVLTEYEKTGEFPERYRKSISLSTLPSSLSLSISGSNDGGTEATESTNLWSKLGSYNSNTPSKESKPSYSLTENPLSSISEME
ncbi:hypothetical protein HOP50_09g54900 [Chloropicon primus]|uniref:Uncharacterized protein n=1 Tax=Chloropicon primus TaxID=1764295 RepID=A0A5B8MU28_9CHLO|nr:hypothetical protein A3770_09p54580 [Chloropicon primus]UPR02164.1 hypothetical protein HOP50_09g54900 [Chloropicon primus]|eukprot:QDZ22940.1 hypothetical protein A3770_09p54580 [Chloropicon primus]